MDVYSEILKAFELKEDIVLATIVSTSGSTPAAALSKMVVKHKGTVSAGTVGGGCMEGDVLHAAKRLSGGTKAEVVTFHLNETNIDQGLICGGTLEILIEPVSPEQRSLIEELRELRASGEDVVLATFLQNGGTIPWKHIVRPRSAASDDPFFRSRLPDLEADLKEEVRKAYQRHQTRRVKTKGGELFLEPALGEPGLVIFGGGHVSKYVSKAASMAGFRVTVVDDRPEYANPERFPEAGQTVAVEYAEAMRRVSILPSTYVVIVTRGHRSDEVILEQVLKTPAKYIGMIGSKRKILSTYKSLAERGTPLASLKKVYAPIGLDVGAVTAEEIAVSITAEMIAVRRGLSSASSHKSKNMNALFSSLEKQVTNP
jgi:xanthine dehydrogenase accessory factor